MSDEQPTDEERYPLLSESGRRMLKFMREHPSAPIFKNQSGNKLRAEDLPRLAEFEREVFASVPRWAPGEPPVWVAAFVRSACAKVPHYRRHLVPRARFEELSTVDRSELGRDIAAFVPDDLPLERMINFRTSGTTGHAVLIASHPLVAASYLSLHKKALAHFGVELRAGAGQMGVVLIGYQKKCFTYVSVTPQMGESGLAKINLHRDDWRDPADRARYLDALDAEMYTGDPVSFAELLKLPLTTRPRALLSTSMTLLPELRRELEARFGCPVIDVYSLNEAGPVAFADGEHWHLLQPRMYVEVLDEDGKPLPAGEHGEVALTGGFNPWLPLIRYRTGDFASLGFFAGEPRLVGLSGRAPVRFRAESGEWLNNIEVTHALAPFSLAQWTLCQKKDGSFLLRSSGGDRTKLRQTLSELFGATIRIEIETDAVFDGKVRQYTSELV